jgi:DNA-binding MarR family transcriptional regulator
MSKLPMPSDTACNCLAVRQAARHIIQFYDRCLAPTGLRTTQFSIVAKLGRLGPLTINTLASELVMDRTTLGRIMLPLQRDGLIAVESGPSDRRSRELHLTKAGAQRLGAARKLWNEAQARFEAAFGGERASNLRNELRAVVASELELTPHAGSLETTSARRKIHHPQLKGI